MEKEKTTYLTIKSSAIGEMYKEKSSKFIGYAVPVSTEDQVKEQLAKIKAEHSKARHWCYAWQLGIDDIRYRANDDGEPNNSAGKPIYGQILANNLTNILIVVVRYYGGTKLGVGGLISAYKKAAYNSINESVIIKKIVKKNIGITFEYKDINIVMRLINKFDIEILSKKMELDCNYILAVHKSKYEVFKVDLTNYINIKIYQED